MNRCNECMRAMVAVVGLAPRDTQGLGLAREAGEGGHCWSGSWASAPTPPIHPAVFPLQRLCLAQPG